MQAFKAHEGSENKMDIYSCSSGEEFRELFKKKYYEEEKVVEFHQTNCTLLSVAITEDNLSFIKKADRLFQYLNNLEEKTNFKRLFSQSRNQYKEINVVILSCKYNKETILKYLLSKDSKLLSILYVITQTAVLPTDVDKDGHTAFYYAMLSNNIKLLNMLIDKWPGNYFKVHVEKLKIILSTTYSEFKLKNILLSKDMELWLLEKLMNFNFFNNCIDQEENFEAKIKKINLRINFLIETINDNINENINDANDTLLFTLKSIAKSIHILKRKLKSTYDKLPWEEIEFCLTSFIMSHTKQKALNIFYKFNLNARKICRYVITFGQALQKEKDNILKYLNVKKESNYPNLKREECVLKLIGNNPDFNDLINDYYQIRDVDSLQRINTYISLAVSVDPKQREGQLVMMRALQVIGECLKNSLESPKMSEITSELLLLSLSKNTRNVVIDLRNSLSHSHSLSQKIEIEKKSNINFFSGVQADVKKIAIVINDLLCNYKTKILREYLQKVIDCKNQREMKEIAKAFENIGLETILVESLQISTQDNLKKKVEKLSGEITEKTLYQEDLLKKMFNVIKWIENRSQQTKEDYLQTYSILFSMMKTFSEKFDDNILRVIKYFAKQALQNTGLTIKPAHCNTIAELSLKIFDTFSAKASTKNIERKKSLYEILHTVQLGGNNIRCIEKFRAKLEVKSSNNKKRRAYTISQSDKNYYLSCKLSYLKELLNGNALHEDLCTTFHSYLQNKTLQVIIEMLVLDIMSIYSDASLENNMHFLDEDIPLLVGRALRNHLAHHNDVVDIMASPLMAIILNARKLAKELNVENKRKIGQLILDDPFSLKKKHDQHLVIMNTQEKMFEALEHGNIGKLEQCLKEGADIRGRSINSWTALHFAAKSSNLENIKFLIKESININTLTSERQNILHIAAAYGRDNIVEFLLQEAKLNVDSADSLGKTALHFAAENGHLHAVQVLLRNNANINVKDISGVLPIFYAVRYNHTDVVDVLLETFPNIHTVEALGGFTLLHEASERGQVKIVELLLRKNVNVNATTDKDWTPLHGAALNGHLPTVNVLIRKGADVNAKAITGCTALHFAAENNHEAVVSALLKSGANVNAADKSFKNTALHYAALQGREKLVNILLQNGARADISTSEGMSPLHYAAHVGCLEIVKALLLHNVKIDARNAVNATPLHLATEMNHEQIVRYLIKCKSRIDAQDINGFTPLHIASSKGWVSISQLLIEKDASICVRDSNGSTPLHLATVNGNTDILDLLLKCKAEVNSRDKMGLTPVHRATLNGNEKAAGILIDNGADCNLKDPCGLSPLHTAVFQGNFDCIQLLTKKTVDKKKLVSALYFAVQTGKRETVKYLIENGALVNSDTDSEQSALILAVKLGNCEIVKDLIKNGANVNAYNGKALYVAVLQGTSDMVKLLLNHNCCIDYRSIGNLTLLHIAAKEGLTEIVEALIAKGADVHAQAADNTTPLFIAAHHGHEDVVEILISKGSKINLKSNEGLTPLHAAATFGHSYVVEILLENKVDVDVRDNKNRTALELAVAYGHIDVVKTFLDHSQLALNFKGNDDWTILHIASQESSVDIVKYLIEKGADVHATNTSGSKPIHIAAREGHIDTLKLFLKCELSIDEIGSHGQTLLHYSASNGQLEMMKFLLAERADVCAKDESGVTPLHMAAAFGHRDAVKCLLENGAIYDAVDKLNRKPSELAVNNDVVTVFQSIAKLFEAVKKKVSLSEVEKHIKMGAYVDTKNAQNGTPLHYAAWKGNDALVNMLLKNGANPNSRGKNGYTPLHYAVKYSFVSTVKILLGGGAVYNFVSDSGKTPLDYAVDKSLVSLFKLLNESFKCVENGNSQVVRTLNKIKDKSTVKAVMCARNSENKTLVVFAIQNNFKNVQQLKDVTQGDLSIQLNVAMNLGREGNYIKSLNVLQTLYEKRKEILGLYDPGTFDIETHMITVLYSQGAYQKALHMARELLGKQIAVLSSTEKSTLKTRNFIALILHRLGQNEESLKIYQEIYQTQEEMLDPNHSDILDTQLHMALALDALGRHEEALLMNRKVFEIKTAVSGPFDPFVIRAQNNIAMVLTNQGDTNEALKIYKEVLEKKKIFFGKDHADTLRTLLSIAAILHEQGKHHESLEAFREVLKVQKAVLGPNYPHTLNTEYLIANVLFSQGKWVQALEAYKRTFNQRKIVFGENNPYIKDTILKMKVINMRLKMEGSSEPETFDHLQKDINIAASNGDVKTLEALLNNGIDVNVQDVEGRTPLHFAVSSGDINAVKLLLKNGADINETTSKNNTALHIAVSKEYLEIVHVLLQSVSSSKLVDFLNVQTMGGGMTALHVAAKNGSLEIVKMLLARGATYNCKNNEGKTPKPLSVNQNVSTFLALLDELFIDAESGNIKMIDKLEKMTSDEIGCLINARNNLQNTLLQTAIANKHKDLSKKLLQLLMKSN